MSQKLPHYLRNHRKRAGLFQEDIAALLGDRTASKVSRYERRHRMPPLLTALAYEAILGKPVAELFGGVYEPIRAAVQRRAKTLSAALEAERVHSLRKGSINAIASGQ